MFLPRCCRDSARTTLSPVLKWTRLRWILLIALIVAGHVAMWLSPNTTPEQALRLTLMNAAIWSVILLPAIGVTMWARTHKALAESDARAKKPER